MNTKRLRTRNQRGIAIVLLFIACSLAWLLLAILLLRSVQPVSQFPL